MRKTSSETAKKQRSAKVHLYCPYCGVQHIDNGWYAIYPHKHHLCFNCGKKFWFRKPTIGIR